MSPAPEPRDPTKAAEITSVLSLGDAKGENGTLANALVPIKECLDAHTPIRSYRLLEWLAHCKDPFVWCAANIPAAVTWVVDRFTNRQVALIKAEAEAEEARARAEKTRAEGRAMVLKAEAEADATRLKAETEAAVARAKGLAEARGLAAEAQSKEADVGRKKQELKERKTATELAAELKKRGVVWATEDSPEEGVLRVGVRKAKAIKGEGPPKELPPGG